MSMAASLAQAPPKAKAAPPAALNNTLNFLCRVIPNLTVLTIREYLTRHCTFVNAQLPTVPLVVKTLLDRYERQTGASPDRSPLDQIVIVRNGGFPSDARVFDVTVRKTMAEVIDAADLRARQDDALASGRMPMRSNNQVRQAGSRAALGNSDAWLAVLSTFGDQFMLDLLSKCFVFQKIPNGNLFQLAGPSIVSLSLNSKVKKPKNGLPISQKKWKIVAVRFLKRGLTKKFRRKLRPLIDSWHSRAPIELGKNRHRERHPIGGAKKRKRRRPSPRVERGLRAERRLGAKRGHQRMDADNSSNKSTPKKRKTAASVAEDEEELRDGLDLLADEVEQSTPPLFSEEYMESVWLAQMERETKKNQAQAAVEPAAAGVDFGENTPSLFDSVAPGDQEKNVEHCTPPANDAPVAQATPPGPKAAKPPKKAAPAMNRSASTLQARVKSLSVAQVAFLFRRPYSNTIGFSQKCSLSTYQGTMVDAAKLVRQTFSLAETKPIPKRLKPVVSIFHQLLTKYHKPKGIHYKGILDSICPILPATSPTRSQSTKADATSSDMELCTQEPSSEDGTGIGGGLRGLDQSISEGSLMEGSLLPPTKKQQRFRASQQRTAPQANPVMQSQSQSVDDPISSGSHGIGSDPGKSDIPFAQSPIALSKTRRHGSQRPKDAPWSPSGRGGSSALPSSPQPNPSQNTQPRTLPQAELRSTPHKSRLDGLNSENEPLLSETSVLPNQEAFFNAHPEYLTTQAPHTGSPLSHLLLSSPGTSDHSASRGSAVVPLTQSKSAGPARIELLATKPIPVAQLQVIPADELVKLFTPQKQVIHFIRVVCRQLIPFELLGSDHNWKCLDNVINKLITSPRRSDPILISTLAVGFRLNDFAWMAPPSTPKASPADKKAKKPHAGPSDHDKRQELLLRLLHWLVSTILVDLIGTNFYVTDTVPHKRQLFFYRRPVWRQIQLRAMTGLCNDGMFAGLSDATAEALLATTKMGPAAIRFLPKQTGFRPIFNLSRKHKSPLRKQPTSINYLLGNAKDILTREARHTAEESLMSSLLTEREVYAVYSKFIDRMKSKYGASGGPNWPVFYVVKTDVRKAYDTMLTRRLLEEVIYPLLREPNYQLHHYLAISSKHMRLNVSRKMYVIKPAAGDPASMDKATTQRLANTRYNTIFAETDTIFSCTRADQKQMIDHHLQQNIINDGKKYLQRKGIPQGSVLSSLCCSLYYAHVEKKYLRHLTQPDPKDGDALLMRWIDDYLYITTNKAMAEEFAQKMLVGFDDYGLTCAFEKTQANFDCIFQGTQIPQTDNGFIDWCGKRINCATLEIQRNFDQYKGDKLSNGLSFTGVNLGRKMRAYVGSTMPFYSAILFLDTNLTTLESVLKLVANSFMMAAMKMAAYDRCLPNQRKANTPFLLGTINVAISKAVRHLKSKKKQYSSTIGVEIDSLSPYLIRYLALRCFLWVLKRRPEHRFGQLCFQLKAALTQILAQHHARLAAAPVLQEAFSSLTTKQLALANAALLASQATFKQVVL